MLDLLKTDDLIPAQILGQSGAFVWWYLDLVDHSGDGLVLIWSFGLPFLPAPGLPRERPGLALSAYKDGQVEYQLVTELPDGEILPEGWRLGDCWITQSTGPGGSAFSAELQLPTPHGRLTGRILGHNPALAIPGSTTKAVHGWGPLGGLGAGEARLRVGDWSAELKGALYRDRNYSLQPLDGLGIDSWVWGRAAHKGQLVIWYLVEGTHPVSKVFLERDGQLLQLEARVEAQGWTRDRYGRRWARQLTLHTDEGPWVVEQRAPVDRSPFYLRHPVTLEHAGERSAGWGELVVPDRLDRPWMRPFVNMRIQRMGSNSPLLPYFTGPKPPLRWI